jgi:hypothetical protein
MKMLKRQETGYCTNVHAGTELEALRRNLERYACAVKRAVSPEAAMGVGLWLSANAARTLRASGQVEAFRDWLGERGLVPFTFNGFPHGDFHQAIVKHRVYEPTWMDEERLRYTLELIEIQHALLPAGMEGSLSTLPVAWGAPRPTHEQLQRAARRLLDAAKHLARLERETGRLLYLCLEPEPGCVLQRAHDVLDFFAGYLDAQASGDVDHRRYLRVCHDVCHSAVMFEPQEDVLHAYRDAGITVGKVQVSAAVCVDFDRLEPEDRARAFEQLAAFDERRYLHQTVVRERGSEPVFHEDLPPLLRTIAEPARLHGEWRTHFHVPIFLDRFGALSSSRDDILACLRAASALSEVRHFEVETYAWGVLPAALREDDLAAGIAKEMRWFWQTAGV